MDKFNMCLYNFSYKQANKLLNKARYSGIVVHNKRLLNSVWIQSPTSVCCDGTINFRLVGCPQNTVLEYMYELTDHIRQTRQFCWMWLVSLLFNIAFLYNQPEIYCRRNYMQELFTTTHTHMHIHVHINTLLLPLEAHSHADHIHHLHTLSVQCWSSGSGDSL